MSAPFESHRSGPTNYFGISPEMVHKPVFWGRDTRGPGYGDSERGEGDGEGSSPDHLDNSFCWGSGARFFLLCPNAGDFESEVINAACRMRP